MRVRRIRIKHYLIISFLLILFFTLIFFISYTKVTSKKSIIYADMIYQKKIYNDLQSLINEVALTNDFNNIIELYQNKNGEILYVDYNVNELYKLLSEVLANLKNNLQNNHDSLYVKVPFFIASDNFFISNFGPHIMVKMNYVNSLISNIHTKITNYGINNALLEAYISISIEGLIITPVRKEVKKYTYDFLVASKVINGRVPSFYGSDILNNSSLFDVPIN